MSGRDVDGRAWWAAHFAAMIRRRPTSVALGRPFRARPLLLLLLGAALACDREPAPPPNDTAPVGPPAGGDVPAPAAVSYNGWDVAEAGPLLAVAAGSVETAVLVLPQYTDSTLTGATALTADSLAPVSVDLFAPAGRVGGATLLPIEGAAPRAGCTSWPVARVQVPSGHVPPWNAAFSAGRAAPLPLDSLEALSTRDSARVAADVARVASALPEKSTSEFRGLPFVVRSARRFSPAPGTEAFVADVVRRLNQEDHPRTEHLVLVAERRAGVRGARYLPAYVERAEGVEETVEMTELLAAVLLGESRRPTLVLSRDYGDGTAYALLERVAEGKWRLKWSSAYTGC